MFRKFYFAAALVFVLMPFIVFAQATITSVIGRIGSIVNVTIPVLSVLAIAVFMYGVVRYIMAGGDANKESEARSYLVAGLVGLFVLVSFWALISLVVTTFQLDTSGAPPITPSISSPVS